MTFIIFKKKLGKNMLVRMISNFFIVLLLLILILILFTSASIYDNSSFRDAFRIKILRSCSLCGTGMIVSIVLSLVRRYRLMLIISIFILLISSWERIFRLLCLLRYPSQLFSAVSRMSMHRFHCSSTITQEHDDPWAISDP